MTQYRQQSRSFSVILFSFVSRNNAKSGKIRLLTSDVSGLRSGGGTLGTQLTAAAGEEGVLSFMSGPVSVSFPIGTMFYGYVILLLYTLQRKGC